MAKAAITGKVNEVFSNFRKVDEELLDELEEVYNAYGKKLPAIAIFLNDKKDIYEFVRMLNDTDFVNDNGIQIVDGSEGNVLSNGDSIRVYPINVVKGMEFDVVFFHNIDKSNIDKDLLSRYVYVGVSRAAFFLGITMENRIQPLSGYLMEGKKDMGKRYQDLFQN